MATFLPPALKTTLCCLLVFTSLLDTMAQQQPNIIFILTDDQRWNAIGYSGNDLIKTPEMDKLAREGVYFKNALVTTPICAASRASILTGLYERTHKYTFQTGAIRDEYMESSYPKLLRKAGYLTGFFGKFGVNYPETESLFDEVEVYDRNNRSKDHRGYFYKTLNGDTVHLTRYTGQKALDFIDDANTDQPFCLSLSFSAPHAHDGAEAQYFWQEEQDPLYADMQMPGPKLGADQYFEALPGPVRDGFNRTRWKWRYDTPEKYQHSVKGYYRMIKGIDNEIAAIRSKLKEKGLDQNTVIMLMGDNGYFLGERQLAGKWLMYDNSVRVPLIIYDPRLSQHKDVETMALNIDVPSTILDMAGIASPDTWHGQSLVPLLGGQEGSIDRDEVLIEHLWDFVHIPPSEGVRTPEWKYLRYVNDKSAEELYNLQNDPQEIKNLAGEARYAPVLKRLQASCDRLAAEFADPLSGVPHDLMVEYIRSAQHTSITDEHPEFSWIVPQEAGIQKGYQILVSSSKQLAALNQGDVWDSGQVRGSQSVNVEMNTALQKHTEYFWKVRIWDKDNRLSTYSEIQTFQTTDLGGTLSSPNSFQVEHIRPTSLQQLPSGDYFVDFGKSAFGTIELDYTALTPEQLTIRLGEKLLNGKIDRDPEGTIRYTEAQLSVTPEQSHYTLDLKPNERNTGPNAIPLPDSFGVILPFRYCEITNASGVITDQDIVQKAFFHYFEMNESSFTCSDETLNMIWDLCKYSMKATSFAGLYVDGDRERIPYEADAYINQLGHYSTDREYAMAKQTIEYFMEHPTWPTEWLLHTALMVYQDYYYSGDLELAAAYYDGLKVKTLHDLANKDGLISSFHGVDGSYMAALGFKDTTLRLKDIVDWPPAQADTGWKLHTKEGERDGHEMLPINTVVNAFFYANMEIMAELAGRLGKSDDQQYFELMAIKVKNAINDQLYDPKQGAYLDGVGASHASLHANMLPLAFGIVPEHRLAPVVKHIKSRGMACSVYGAQFLLEGLYHAGEAQYALDLMRAKNDRSWWNMIAIGSTITLEAWDMKYKPNSDWNHAWGGAPANIIPRFLWGIQPKKPGYEVVTIKPQMADLTESEIKLPTIRGPIEGSYQRINDRLTQYHITLPANTVAEFVADFSPQAVVSLNGKVVNLTFGSIRLDPGKNNLEIKINSF